MVDYGNAFKKPFQDITKLVIGIVLMILPIVNFLSLGYFIETTKKTLNNDTSLPEWTNWGQLFINGLLSAVIGFIYMIPATIIMFIAFAPIFGIITGAVMGGGDPTVALAGALAGAGVLLMIGLLVFLLTVFLLPMAIVYFAKGGFGNAFNIGGIIKSCLTSNYIVSWIIIAVVTIILTLVLGIIPFIGLAIAGFYLGIIEYTIFAQVLIEQGK